MKNTSIILSVLGFSLSSLLNGQSTKVTTSGSAPEQAVFSPYDSKAKFVSGQDYLKGSNPMDYKNYYGDSLKGFDEVKVKVELLGRYYYGQEFISVMNYRKREFINTKYKIGPQATPKPVPTSGTSNSKLIGSGGNFVNAAPCVNEDFESTLPGTYNTSLAVTGWTLENASTLGNQFPCNNPSNPAFLGGSPEFSIVSTPILSHPYIGNIPNSPLGGNNVAVLNNSTPGFTVTRLSTTFPVTSANSLFQFAYAGSWDGSGHQCCDQPFFLINMFDCTGAPLGCSSLSLTPPGQACQNGQTGYSVTSNGISWCNWQVKYIDLTPYIGSCVTLKVTNGDCNGGAHHGSLYFDAKCGGQLLCQTCTLPSTGTTSIAGPVSFCAGSGLAQIAAPLGYATYSWIAPAGSPSIAPAQSTLATLSISNPVPNACYTVMLVSPSGCIFSSINCLTTTSVNIAGIGTAPSCAGGANGSATVSGNGSGGGYTYTWTSSSNSVVGTASIATGLPPGVYSVTIGGLGSSGCGTAMTTATVGIKPPGVINNFMPFCGNTAYLITSGGSGFQWFNSTGSVSASSGGNSASITVNNPGNGNVWTVTLTNMGCKDSIRYTLGSTTPGFVNVQNISYVCPGGGNNGTAAVNIATAQGAPQGSNSYSVYSTGSTPLYTSFSPPTAANAFPLTALSAGTYSVNAFDGACAYTTSFVVQAFTFTYAVSPISPTLCPGNSIAANLTFSTTPTLTQYSYSWTPTTFLTGTNAITSIISPSAPIGSITTIVYTIVVTSSVINCPVIKTLTITSVNPPTPTIAPIPNMCNTFQPYTINASPPGGTFYSGISGANNPIGSTSGVINPSLALNTTMLNSVYSLTYAISVNTCQATKTATYQVSKFWTAALSSPTVAPMCVTNAPFNLMNIVQSTTNGKWSGIGTNTTNPNIFFPATFNTSAYPTTSVYPVVYTATSSPNATVCPSTSTLNVAVTKTTTPVLTAVLPFCTNAIPFSLSASPGGGGWINNQAVSNAGLVNPAIANVPGSTVTYTTPDGPCLNSNVLTLTTSSFIPATLTGSVGYLCYNSSPVNLLGIVQNSSGTWSAPAGVSQNSFITTGLSTNTYVITYNTNSSPIATLCAHSSTLAVNVSNPTIPNITQVGPMCNNGASMQLTVTPNTGLWTITSYLNANGIFTPSLTSVGNNAVQYVVGTSTCNVQQTKSIAVEAFVSAAITSPISDQCNNGPLVNLSPNTISSLGSWSGPGIAGNGFNPATAGSGQFILNYKTASSPSGLCPDQATVAVNVYSLATPVLTQVGPFCNSHAPLQLQVSPVGGLFGGSNIGVVSLQGKFNPASAIIGNNIVNYSITSGPCVAYAQATIKVEAFVSADFEKYAGPYCSTNERVDMNSFVQHPGGTWSNFTGSGILGNMFNPATANTGNSNLVIYETISASGLCKDSSMIRIEVREVRKMTVVASLQAGCAPHEVVFNTPTASSGTGLWNFGDGSEPVEGLSFVTHLYTHPGNYNIQFDYTDDIGCKSLPSSPGQIIVYDKPKADFSVPDEIFISDPTIQINNLSSVLNNNSYEWKMENQPISKDIHPRIDFSKIGKYTINLVATSEKLCRDEISKIVIVKNNFNIFIPNSFSPNFDGLNDVFLPKFTSYGLDLNSFDMEIFDRWGHSIYRTKDPAKGWDGSVQNKGEALKEGVYVYKIKYKDLEGNVYDKMGNISILK